jgi:hypothetical protein
MAPLPDLITLHEVAALLHRSVRSVQRLPIPIVRIGRKPLYDRRDVMRFVEAHKCLSSSGPALHSTTASSATAAVGFSEARKRRRLAKPDSSSDNSESKSGEKPLQAQSRRRSRSIRLVSATGRSTDAGSVGPQR